MAEVTDAPERAPAQGKGKPEEDPRIVAAREASGGDRGLENVIHASQGAGLDAEEERSALDYLLGGTPPVIHDITVQYETPAGMRPLTFVVRVRDTRKIDEIEQRNLDRNTGILNQITASCELVAECTLKLVDGKREIVMGSEEFLTVPRISPSGERENFKHAASPLALEARFRDQLGLITGTAQEIRRIAGYTVDRVGSAKRRMVTASLG